MSLAVGHTPVMSVPSGAITGRHVRMRWEMSDEYGLQWPYP